MPEASRSRRGTAARGKGVGAGDGASVRSPEQVQAALYRIAETASAAQDMGEFYQAIHAIVGELMDARNFYIVLYDEARQAMNYPFFVDEEDEDIPDPNAWEPMGTGQAAGITAYVLRTGKPLLADQPEQARLVDTGEVQMLGIPAVDWLGVPMVADGRTVGAVVVQSYREDVRHTDAEKELLAFVGQHIATALTRARAIEETRQRNAELAVINEIGQALAKQLDFDPIVELVGERLRAIFGSQDMYVAIYHATTRLITFPYEIENGERFDGGTLQIGEGLTSKVITTRRPLRLHTAAEQAAHGAVFVRSGPEGESWLGVPINAGDRVIGAIALESLQQHAFSEGDERLLTTVASSMGVALENARLFTETKRLLAETDQRAAELAVVNEIGQALAKQLDFRGIIDLVGERLGPILAAHTLSIAIHHPGTDVISFPYSTEAGIRESDNPDLRLGEGLTSRVIQSNRALRLGTSDEAEALGVVWIGARMESFLGVPIPAGDRVLGAINLAAFEPNAYTDADERLLTTLASSMGVALENARLFDETKRLLAQSDQRAAELAVINEIGQALAKQLDFEAICELVGERVGRSSRPGLCSSVCTTARRSLLASLTRSVRASGTTRTRSRSEAG